MEQVDVVYSLALFLGAPAAGGVMGTRQLQLSPSKLGVLSCFELGCGVRLKTSWRTALEHLPGFEQLFCGC